MAKGGLARERFQAKQQQNRIIAQLNQLRGAGFTQEQIRAAGPGAFQTLTQQVVTDTDTLESLAGQYSTDPASLLAANPELKSLQTGMVVNIPSGLPLEQQNSPLASTLGSYNPAMRGRGFGGGLPSNAALGGTTTNQGGQVSMWGGVTPGYNTRLQSYSANPFYKPGAEAGYYQSPGYSLPGATNAPAWTRGVNTQTAPTQTLNATPLQTPRPIQQPRVYNTQSLAGLQAYRITDLYNAVNAGKAPTDAQLDYLIQKGLIQKNTTTSYSGGGYGYGGYKRRGGGGRGGGGGYSPGSGSGRVAGTPQERLPAFSSGAGFNGLVNWRI